MTRQLTFRRSFLCRSTFLCLRTFSCKSFFRRTVVKRELFFLTISLVLIVKVLRFAPLLLQESFLLLFGLLNLNFLSFETIRVSLQLSTEILDFNHFGIELWTPAGIFLRGTWGFFLWEQNFKLTARG